MENKFKTWEDVMVYSCTAFFISYILSILLAVLVLLLMEEMVGTVENMEKERGSSFLRC